jgi:hypothetical protein
MCWALVFFSLIEASDENAEAAIRRDEKQLEKARDIEFAKNSDGGVLALNSTNDDTRLNLETRKANEFTKIWNELKDWNEKIIKDAVLFAAANTPRSTTGLCQSKTSHADLHETELQMQFNSLIWPSLKLRGWTSIPNENAKSIYMFKNNEVWYGICSVNTHATQPTF